MKMVGPFSLAVVWAGANRRFPQGWLPSGVAIGPDSSPNVLNIPFRAVLFSLYFDLISNWPFKKRKLEQEQRRWNI